MNENILSHQFTYHAPTPEQVETYATIHNAARELALLLNQLIPDSADKSAAIRQLRECVMTANAAIACASEEDKPIAEAYQIARGQT